MWLQAGVYSTLPPTWREGELPLQISVTFTVKKTKSPELSGIRLNVFAGLIFQYTVLLYIRRQPALLLMLFKKVKLA